MLLFYSDVTRIFFFTFHSLKPEKPAYFLFYAVLLYQENVHLTYFILFLMYCVLIIGLCTYIDALTQDLKIVVSKFDWQTNSENLTMTLRQTIDLQNNIDM